MPPRDALATDDLIPAAKPAVDILTPKDVDADTTTLRCAICGTPSDEAHSLPTGYSNPVCQHCDQLAVGESGDSPWHGYPPGEEPETEDGVIHMAPDHGENPVFIAGAKCWRRYRFGGWVTRRDAFDCDTLEEFQARHRIDGDWIHAFNDPQPDGLDLSEEHCEEVHERMETLSALAEDAATLQGDTPSDTALHDFVARVTQSDIELPPEIPDTPSPEQADEYASAVFDAFTTNHEYAQLCERYHATE